MNSTTFSTPVRSYPNTARNDWERKTCTGCGQVKVLAQFHRQRTSKDGRRPRCKSCSATYEHNRQQTDHYKQRRHNYQSAHPETWGWGWTRPTEEDFQFWERYTGCEFER